jgi:hypothetical protein
MITAIKWFYHPTVRPIYFSMDRAARRDSLAYSAHLAKSMVFGDDGYSVQEWNMLTEEKKLTELQASVLVLRLNRTLQKIEKE